MVKNGVSFDVALSLGKVERAAMAIHFSRFEGSRFNIEKLEWVKEDR